MLIVPPNSLRVRFVARAESLRGIVRLGCPTWSVAPAPITSAATSTTAQAPSTIRAWRTMRRAIVLTAPPGCGA